MAGGPGVNTAREPSLDSEQLEGSGKYFGTVDALDHNPRCAN